MSESSGTSADRARPPILANRPRSFGAMPVQRIAIKANAPPSKASMPPHTMRRAATKIHHRNRIVRSKREPIAAFPTGPIR